MSFVPNFLTILRLILAPIVAWALWKASVPPDLAAGEVVNSAAPAISNDAALLAAGLFALAALTDLFDGLAARAFDAESKLGRILDPIADKALVGLPLIVLSVIAIQNQNALWPIIAGATAVIVLRDVLITILRMTASDGEGARVTSLAKWKTTAELLAVGIPIFLTAAPAIAEKIGRTEFAIAPWMIWGWLGLLALAALLSAITGLGYLTGSASKPAPEA